ncbi:acylphosphatase [Tenuifilum thalassicum]|uniref:acylphosphatase n=1 Tax=Tenuifilum thalassicum TaxID=2590900 RepID=A0A7D3XLX4_9BACT|nr:acylphosphatase [Tenuifilum thalassicum]QKG79756.1 acylphosphatase [Tenuifilum thalassicum]
MKSVAITVKGRVQGVGYRFFILRHAKELGVKGFVKNLTNGDVYIEATGTPEQIDTLVKHCWSGPISSIVKEVIVEDSPNAHSSLFAIIS